MRKEVPDRKPHRQPTGMRRARGGAPVTLEGGRDETNLPALLRCFADFMSAVRLRGGKRGHSYLASGRRKNGCGRENRIASRTGCGAGESSGRSLPFRASKARAGEPHRHYGADGSGRYDHRRRLLGNRAVSCSFPSDRRGNANLGCSGRGRLSLRAVRKSGRRVLSSEWEPSGGVLGRTREFYVSVRRTGRQAGAFAVRRELFFAGDNAA